MRVLTHHQPYSYHTYNGLDLSSKLTVSLFLAVFPKFSQKFSRKFWQNDLDSFFYKIHHTNHPFLFWNLKALPMGVLTHHQPYSYHTQKVPNVPLKLEAKSFIAYIKGDTPDRTPQVGFCGCCLIGAIGMSLSDKSMIFGSGKSWNVGLNHEKVFYPLRKFFTPLFGHLMLQIVFSNSSIFLIFMRSKGG